MTDFEGTLFSSFISTTEVFLRIASTQSVLNPTDFCVPGPVNTVYM